jgi:hypothetical protein
VRERRRQSARRLSSGLAFASSAPSAPSGSAGRARRRAARARGREVDVRQPARAPAAADSSSSPARRAGRQISPQTAYVVRVPNDDLAEAAGPSRRVADELGEQAGLPMPASAEMQDRPRPAGIGEGCIRPPEPRRGRRSGAWRVTRRERGRSSR